MSVASSSQVSAPGVASPQRAVFLRGSAQDSKQYFTALDSDLETLVSKARRLFPAPSNSDTAQLALASNQEAIICPDSLPFIQDRETLIVRWVPSTPRSVLRASSSKGVRWDSTIDRKDVTGSARGADSMAKINVGPTPSGIRGPAARAAHAKRVLAEQKRIREEEEAAERHAQTESVTKGAAASGSEAQCAEQPMPSALAEASTNPPFDDNRSNRHLEISDAIVGATSTSAGGKENVEAIPSLAPLEGIDVSNLSKLDNVETHGPVSATADCDPPSAPGSAQLTQEPRLRHGAAFATDASTNSEGSKDARSPPLVHHEGSPSEKAVDVARQRGSPSTMQQELEPGKSACGMPTDAAHGVAAARDCTAEGEADAVASTALVGTLPSNSPPRHTSPRGTTLVAIDTNARESIDDNDGDNTGGSSPIASPTRDIGANPFRGSTKSQVLSAGRSPVLGPNSETRSHGPVKCSPDAQDVYTEQLSTAYRSMSAILASMLGHPANMLTKKGMPSDFSAYSKQRSRYLDFDIIAHNIDSRSYSALLTPSSTHRSALSSFDSFTDDLSCFWTNIRGFFGPHSAEHRCATQLERFAGLTIAEWRKRIESASRASEARARSMRSKTSDNLHSDEGVSVTPFASRIPSSSARKAPRESPALVRLRKRPASSGEPTAAQYAAFLAGAHSSVAKSFQPPLYRAAVQREEPHTKFASVLHDSPNSDARSRLSPSPSPAPTSTLFKASLSGTENALSVVQNDRPQGAVDALLPSSPLLSRASSPTEAKHIAELAVAAQHGGSSPGRQASPTPSASAAPPQSTRPVVCIGGSSDTELTLSDEDDASAVEEELLSQSSADQSPSKKKRAAPLHRKIMDSKLARHSGAEHDLTLGRRMLRSRSRREAGGGLESAPAPSQNMQKATAFTLSGVDTSEDELSPYESEEEPTSGPSSEGEASDSEAACSRAGKRRQRRVTTTPKALLTGRRSGTQSAQDLSQSRASARRNVAKPRFSPVYLAKSQN
ncbi:hypothetical protein IE81DRAFT_325054 [Ceraceosorus guamensis]|uniref:Bromo domain-containing protein n=1 Tax=Ceraceosorus guamensis TaxID=1522189 RepID=A0A316VZN2_9BASI|nr:hypothetical protein IE81DRAFT_325054 [Ceraceosorus guamensis]PWN40965.1 hypothetical protein IE81DRAFT_325054 [Ceraceosorus guamensis]